MFTVLLKNGQTWLVCGGRAFDDEVMFEDAMLRLMRIKGCPDKIIHGGAAGADDMAADLAARMAIPCRGFIADWAAHGRAAGPLRNQRMLDEGKPSFVVAFPGGRGTADMVRRAREANIDVAEIVPTAVTAGERE
jgi:hypothetical protein